MHFEYARDGGEGEGEGRRLLSGNNPHESLSKYPKIENLKR